MKPGGNILSIRMIWLRILQWRNKEYSCMHTRVNIWRGARCTMSAANRLKDLTSWEIAELIKLIEYLHKGVIDRKVFFSPNMQSWTLLFAVLWALAIACTEAVQQHTFDLEQEPKWFLTPYGFERIKHTAGTISVQPFRLVSGPATTSQGEQYWAVSSFELVLLTCLISRRIPFFQRSLLQESKARPVPIGKVLELWWSRELSPRQSKSGETMSRRSLVLWRWIAKRWNKFAVG